MRIQELLGFVVYFFIVSNSKGALVLPTLKRVQTVREVVYFTPSGRVAFNKDDVLVEKSCSTREEAESMLTSFQA